MAIIKPNITFDHRQLGPGTVLLCERASSLSQPHDSRTHRPLAERSQTPYRALKEQPRSLTEHSKSRLPAYGSVSRDVANDLQSQ